MILNPALIFLRKPQRNKTDLILLDLVSQCHTGSAIISSWFLALAK